MSGRVRIVALVLFFCAALGATAAGAAPGASKLTGELPQVLAGAKPGELIPVSIVLADQLTGPALAAKAPARAPAPEKRAALTKALREHAARTQAGLLKRLEVARAAGQAARVRPLWIGNVVGADLTRAQVEAIAARPEVDHVNWNPKRDVFLEGPQACVDPFRAAPLAPAATGGGTDSTIECGVNLISAPRVWNELGNRGEGAVVAMIDTGACWTHPDIAHQVWVNPGEDLNHNGVVMDAADMNGIDDDGNGFVDDLIGWNFDFGTNSPTDDNGHGSHTAGTVGGDGTSGVATGVAPGVRLMILRVGVTFADEVDVWNAMQYAANNNADLISMSLGWPHSQNPDRHQWRVNSENVIAAGTAMVIAAGNEGYGAEPDNVRTPGDVPAVITVGAVDCSDNLASFSSRGPVSWSSIAPWNDYPYPPGLIKPDVSGPGVDTQSSSFCSGYTFMSGTSMATPHVAGAAALIVSAAPGLDNATIRQILEETSVDLGAAGKDNEFGTGRIDAYAAVNNVSTPDGKVKIVETTLACAGTMHLEVSDKDLQGSGTLSIRVTSATEPAGELAVLTENGTSGIFRGTLSTGPGAPAADGVLQVAASDVVTATYVDANDGHGGTNVVKTDTAAVDCTPPQISAVHATDAGLTTATVRWQTDESSDSVVTYGASIPPASSSSSASLATAHAMALSNLSSCTVYYYKVSSADAPGNRASDDAGGLYYHFETLGDFGAGPQPCHAGKVTLDAPIYSCSATVALNLTDMDLNLNPGVADTARVLVTSTTEPAGEWITLTETGPNTSRFTGAITVQAGAPAADGKIEAAHGDTITASYFDSNDGTGQNTLSYATASADCAGPAITGLAVGTITDQRATVSWTTGENANTVLEWGTTPALGNTISSATLQTGHAVMINRFDTCQQVYFRVRATDAYGNQAVGDNHGAPFAFMTDTIPGLYWRDTFEAATTTWTLTGEWQVGAPQGKGGSGGGATDPTSAYNNQKVLGNDLTGLGSFPGDYESNVSETARSPILVATSWHNTKLLYHRRLNVAANDDATVYVYVGSGLPVYTNSKAAVADTDWVYESFDVASRVDGMPQVRVEFRLKSDASNNRSGWNVDDVIFKNSTLPDFAPCGSCGAAPSFAGATGATDNNACAASGVTVAWAGAPSWGSGAAGSYAVYRGTAAGFPADAAHRIAAGVAGTNYNDAAAPAGANVYLVRAENAETCSTGPANGGVTDANAVYVGVTESTSQATPSAITALDVTATGRVNVRLGWPAAGSAASYRVLRSTTPQAASFSTAGSTTGLAYEDVGRAADQTTYFYLVRGVNACGQEGP